MKTIVQSTTGVKYEIINPEKPLGEGTFGITFQAKRIKDKQPCVIKKFKPQTEPRFVKLLRLIRENVTRLSREHVMDYETHKRCEEIIDPINEDCILEFEDGTFGYVMILVDMSRFVSIDAFRTQVTDIRIFCVAVKKFAHALRSVHLAGWCYKDISPKNVYFDPKTGDVRIIDCDNISTPERPTVLGTPNFIAPELYQTANPRPNNESDYFSMALLLYKLFTGAHPLLGKQALEYMYTNNLDLYSAMPRIYGTNALFVFDPNNNANSIRGYRNAQYQQYFDVEIASWDSLPTGLQEAFIKTFSTGIKPEQKHMRTKEREWMALADDLISHHTIKCKKCQKYGFGESTTEKNAQRLSGKKFCWFCGELMPPIEETVEPQAAVFAVSRNISKNVRELVVRRQQELKASIHKDIPELNVSGWLQVKYYPPKNLLVAINNTPLIWTYTLPGHSTKRCKQGGLIPLIKGTKIVIKPGMLEMTVKDITE